MSGGVELGGNKVRKLEFLLADALEQQYDAVVTIGGEQSNHCRATAAACRMVNLEPHLILRTRRANSIAYTDDTNANANTNTDTTHHSDSFGIVGNILFNRMVGAKIYTCTPGEYGRVGSEMLVNNLCQDIASSSSSSSSISGASGSDNGTNQKKVYPIPVGGSNGLGTWGYVHGVEELMNQMNYHHDGKNNNDHHHYHPIDHIVFACGSGGTAAGITLGITLAHGVFDNMNSHNDDKNTSTPTQTKIPHIHAMGVCDDPEYFYHTVSKIADEMGLKIPSSLSDNPTTTTTTTDKLFKTTQDFIRTYMTAHQAKGLGYAISTDDELDFIIAFALETGIVLDPVYSGKALYHFVTKVLETNPEEYRDSTVLFWHTGGSLGMYDKEDAIMSKMETISPVARLDVYGKMK